uniref:Uncharacterized protein n=1 Tax=Nicotiana tabacum TaxID=4097 RepID=A0A1S4AJM0_TOBAC|nr:PREDICTED: uncharacterized protein LOC107798345 [Nicotiana tabacum]
MVPDVLQVPLPRLTSDHSPIMLDGSRRRSLRIPFRFENMWLQVSDFEDRVDAWWNGYVVTGTPSFRLASKLKMLKGDIRKWNKEVFGRVEVKIRELINEVGEMERVEALRALEESERVRKEEANQELAALAVAQETTEKQAIEQRLASLQRLKREASAFNNTGMREWLERAMEEEEVRAAVVSCAGDKARGSDRFTLAFFQHCWRIVKVELMETTVEFQETREFERSLNASFVTIAPKKERATSIKDYRPISLLESIYKIISKIVSGLKINHRKCEITPMGEVDNIEEIAHVLNCKVGTLPTTYLELPLGASSKDLAMWNPVIERVEKWLAGWQKKYLSIGGKEVLIKSTLSSIPTNYMSFLHERLERLQQNFLWDTTEGARRYHLVNWRVVTSPKERGGLGVKDLKVFNKALLGKWIWRFGVEESAFWRGM